MAKIHFSPAEQEVVDCLRDRQWHCTYTELVMKDDRARVSKIRRKLQPHGYEIESKLCNLHNHDSKLVMRRIIQLTPPATQRTPANNEPSLANKQYAAELVRRFDAGEPVFSVV